MSDSYLERVAGELADLALADEQRTADEKIVNGIAEVLGSSSQTLQEAFLTAVRVRRAEARARAILIERGGEIIVSKRRMITDERDGAPRKEKRDPTQFERPRDKVEKTSALPEDDETVDSNDPPKSIDEDVVEPDQQTDKDENSEEDTLDDVMELLDTAFASKDGDTSGKSKVKPSRPKR